MKAFLTSEKARRIFMIVGSMLLSLFVLACIQNVFGIGSTEKHLVNTKMRPKAEGKAVRVLLPKSARHALTPDRGFVIEEGRRLKIAAKSNKRVQELGQGRYRFGEKYARFSATDDTHPLKNGRRYTLVTPWLVKTKYLLLLGGGALICLAFVGRPKLRWVPKPAPFDRFAPLGIFAIGVIVGVGFLLKNPNLTDGTLLVKGMPYSDAIGWNELAIGLKEGRGFIGPFDSHRPFYGITLGSLYLVTGESLNVAKALNVVAFALTAMFVYLLGRAAYFGRVVGLAGAAFVLFAARHLPLNFNSMTEGLGVALTAISVHLMFVAVVRKKWEWFLIAGFFIGVANLTRTYTLLATPIYGLVVVLASWGDTARWRQILLRGVVLAGGTLIAVLPWMLYLKSNYGILSISSNSPHLLYATAGTERGTWSADIYEEATRDGVTPNDTAAEYRYFQKRFKEAVAKDPAAYFKRIGGYFVAFFDHVDLQAPLWKLLLVLVVWLTAIIALQGRPFWMAVVILAMLYVSTWLVKLPGIALVSAAAIISLLVMRGAARFAILTLLATLIGQAILSSLVGNFGIDRMGALSDWIVVLILLGGVASAIQWIGRKVDCDFYEGKPKEEFDPSARIMTYVLLVFFGLGAAAIGIRGAVGDPTPPVRLTESQRTEILKGKTDLPAAEDELYCEIVLLGEYRCEIGANEIIDHWSRAFEQRPEARTLFKAREGVNLDESQTHITLQVPSNVKIPDGDRPVVCIGKRNFDPNAPHQHEFLMIEVMEFVPLP